MKKNVLFNLIAFLLLSLFSYQMLVANDEIEQVKKDLPKMLGANNVGTDFYLTFHPCWETEGDTNKLRVYVSSAVVTNVTLEVVGKAYSDSKQTIANDIIEFVLDPEIGQCYRKDAYTPPDTERVYPGYAIHVYSDDPIICYGVTRYHYTSDGFLALPVNSFGKEYIVASYSDPTTNEFQWLPSYTSVVAAYDNTSVRFTLGGTETTLTKGGLQSGEYSDFSMNKGDVLVVSGYGAFADLSGSKVISNKPVGVISGNFCAYVPSDKGYCDYIIEMELPTDTWGRDYLVTPIKNRKNNSILKIFPKEGNTNIYRDSVLIANITNAGGVLGLGYIEIRADDGNPSNVVISGDKQISVTQYNTGQEDDDVASDPFQLVLTPIEQFQKEIIFNTPGIKGGFGFSQNFINIVYETENQSIIPDDLEIGTVLDSQVIWQQINSISSVSYPFAIEIGGKKYSSVTVQLSGDGVYRIKSNNDFTAYAYGFSDYDSYGFPTSVILADLESGDAMPPQPIYASSNLDKEIDGTVVDNPDGSISSSKLSLVYFNKAKSSNYSFSYSNFMPGINSQTDWKAVVNDLAKDAKAFITFCDKKGNDTTILITYSSPKFNILPSNIDFGVVKPGAVHEKVFYLKNESKDYPVKIVELNFKSNLNNFEITGLNLPISLPANDSIPLTMKFTATDIDNVVYSDSIGISNGDVLIYKGGVKAKVRNDLGVDDNNILINNLVITPNPTNSDAYVEFYLEKDTYCELAVFSTNGELVKKISNELFESGNQKIQINTNGMSSGTYNIILKTAGFTKSTKLIIKK